MTVYDISQELLSCAVYPGDTKPDAKMVRAITEGDVCNVTDLTICVHNGTHIDAPLHFIDGAASIYDVTLEKTVGYAEVAEFDRDISETEIMSLPDSCRMLLVKGKGWISCQAANAVLRRGILLVGTESQSIGPADAPAPVHRILLGAGVVLLEGIRLDAVPTGRYLLVAAPINISGSDGAPVRAILIKDN